MQRWTVRSPHVEMKGKSKSCVPVDRRAAVILKFPFYMQRLFFVVVVVVSHLLQITHALNPLKRRKKESLSLNLERSNYMCMYIYMMMKTQVIVFFHSPSA